MLERSSDRKTANLSNKAGNGALIKNAFGLPSGIGYSCPGATSICERVCYAGKLEKQYVSVMALALRNWNQVKDASLFEMTDLLRAMVAEFVGECDKRGAEKVFRIHHDGDFFSVKYATAWAAVVEAFPDVTFWAYTRSFTSEVNVVPFLADIPNLSLYLSVDEDNKHLATAILNEYPSVMVAALGETFADGAGITQEVRGDNKPGGKCPENAKQIPLITTEGGACFSCGLCVKGKADVRFAIKKR